MIPSNNWYRGRVWLLKFRPTCSIADLWKIFDAIIQSVCLIAGLLMYHSQVRNLSTHIIPAMDLCQAMICADILQFLYVIE